MWKFNLKHGKGMYKDSKGMYNGMFENNVKQGHGEYDDFANESKYRGEFVNDIKEDCKGIEFWMDGSKYTGAYKDGKKHGNGEMKWGNGDIYKG